MSGTLVIETLVAVILLIVFVIIGPIFEKIHFHYAHESGVVMLLGIAVTLLLNAFSPEVIIFYFSIVLQNLSVLIQKYFLF